MSETKQVPVVESSRACGCADDCCAPSDTAATEIPAGADPRAIVREKYGAIAQGKPGSTCGCCSGPVDTEAVLAEIGYTAEQAAMIPEGANLGLGCGNPIAHSDLRPGEVVVDLGSGGGIDCFLAGREVGPTGRVIGVDMTPSMIERARAAATRVGAANVEFRLGEIEHLPVADASVDAVISNCVVNLSPEKPRAFAEAYRVLKPGGRLVVSDLVLTKPLTAEQRNNVELYVGCVAGAALEDEYLQLIREAGFARVEVLSRQGYAVGTEGLEPESPERDAFLSVVSVKVRAFRP
jgi:SAM-dependent methyltransferase